MFSERPEIFHESLRTFTEAEEFGTAVLVLTVHPPEASERLADLTIAARTHGLAVLWTAGAMAAASRRRLMESGIAVFEDAGRCMQALAARADVTPAPAETTAAVPPSPLRLPSTAAYTEAEVLAVLRDAGVPVVATIECATAEDAAAAAERLGGAVVVKASARDLLHKSDAGAVVVGVAGAEQAARAHERVMAAALAAGARPEGSIVQPFAAEGVELIVGVRRDPLLGPVLVVGPGGLLAEIVGGASRRMLPLGPGDALAMLDELRIAPLMHGYRGGPPADLDAAVAAIEAVAGAAMSIGAALDALEINPHLVHPAGAGVTAVDGLLLLRG
jgi:acyl-CoA synthetase (NDP forming)